MHSRKVAAKSDGKSEVNSLDASSPKKRLVFVKSFRNPVTFVCGAFRLVVGVVYIVVVSLFVHVGVFFWPLTVILRWLKHSKPLAPYELVERLWCWGFLKVLGVEVIAEGTEHVVADPTIIMFSHASNLDSMLVYGASPVKPKFIFKKSLLYRMPLLFPLAALLGHVSIDRSKIDQAIQSLEKAARQIRDEHVSIAISPEGTRSRTGELMPFKKGPFHLAKSVGAPITPAVIFNNFNLWRPKQLLPHCGDVRIRFLPQIPVTPEDTVESLQAKVRCSMEEALQSNQPTVEESGERFLPGIVFLSIVLSSAYVIGRFLF
eukprot:TRINITY_DN12325_c0_g1_i1.p1 TRINITY_DN12325_c0_g1~~TRINITY_DN12325_c0_g1_i1.p1  ORF type:complete len:335 (+),score=10.45 TRINITY_DN12325_c0_g1_i1:52-1005(+)